MLIARLKYKGINNVITGARATAVCAINAAIADKIAAEYHAAAFYHADDLINSTLVDAVFICSIGPAHKAQIFSAFKADKPVFGGKPPAFYLEAPLEMR